MCVYYWGPAACIEGIIILSFVCSKLPTQSLLSPDIYLFDFNVSFPIPAQFMPKFIQSISLPSVYLFVLSPLPLPLATTTLPYSHIFISLLLLGSYVCVLYVCVVCLHVCGVVHMSAEWMEPSCRSCQSLCQKMKSGCSEDTQHLSGTLQIRVLQAQVCVCVRVGT